MKKVILLQILIAISLKMVGQNRNPVFIGIQPAITVEPFYEKGVFDINIFPAVVEIPIGNRVDFRFLPLINYHVGDIKNGISDLGFYSVFPVYFKEREKKTARPHGLYLGPVFGIGRNLINEHYTTTIALEPGYLFEAKNKFTISIGLQLGGSHFMYNTQPNEWVFHWGPKISLGFWL